MSKISELSDGGVIQGGDTLIAVRSGGNVKVTYGGTTTANIDGGTIDGTVIGGTTPAAGSFTSLTSTGIDVTGTVTSTGFGSQLATTLFEQNVLKSSVTASSGAFVRMAVSSASNPTYAFEDDTDTGVFTSGANTLNFATAATERMRIDSSGNVGIGTSNIGARLTLGDASSADSTNLIRSFRGAGTSTYAVFGDNGGGAMVEHVGGGSVFFKTSNTERMRISANGNVGIGTDSLTTKLHVDQGADSNGITLAYSGRGASRVEWEVSGVNNEGASFIHNNGTNRFTMMSMSRDVFEFRSNNTERMRLDSSGNLLVGKTSENSAVEGQEFKANGFTNLTKSGDNVLNLNRLTSDGDIAVFRKDGSTVGSIGCTDGLYPYIGGSLGGFGDVYLVFVSNSSQSIRPSTSAGASSDGFIDLGATGARFNDIYATNGTIQTSDRNEKQDIEELSDAEQRVAVACKGLLRKFRWIDSVEEKGDDARIHFGIMAQDLEAAFAAEGLDAGRYAMFISTTWWESTEVIPAVEAQEAVVDEEGNVVEEAVEAQEERTVVHTHDTAEEAPEGSVERTRLGVRYSELLAFIIAAI